MHPCIYLNTRFFVTEAKVEKWFLLHVIFIRNDFCDLLFQSIFSPVVYNIFGTWVIVYLVIFYIKTNSIVNFQLKKCKFCNLYTRGD